MNHSQMSENIDALEQWFAQRNGCIVAYSGGVDSTLVLFLARKFLGKQKAIGVISDSPSLKRRDLLAAKDFCKEHDILFEVIHTNELEDSRYNSNEANRCYFCKEHLYTDIEPVRHLHPGFSVLSGTNMNDFSDYRPGLLAAAKFKIRAPLAECKITKLEIREMARYFDLPNWNKPAAPCLSSRIPYNNRITPLKLRQVEEAEELLFNQGFTEARVRHLGDNASIEVLPRQHDKLHSLETFLIPKMQDIGFNNILIDPEGLVSGKLNRAIGKTQT